MPPPPPPTKTAAGEPEEQIKSVRDHLWKCLSWKETRKAAAPPHGRGFGPRRVRPLLAGSSETRDPGFRRCKLGCSGWPRSRRNPDFRGRRGLQIARLARWTGRKRAREPNRNQTACEVGEKKPEQDSGGLGGVSSSSSILPFLWQQNRRLDGSFARCCSPDTVPSRPGTADIVAKSAHQARGC